MIMKYKRLAVVLLLCVGLFACGKTEATNSDVLQQLTEAQKQYLYEQNYTDEGILLMDYESINYVTMQKFCKCSVKMKFYF